MAMKFRASQGIESRLDSLPKKDAMETQKLPDAKEVTPEQLTKIVQHVVVVLGSPDVLQSSAKKVYKQFARSDDKMLEEDFNKLLDHLGSAWGLQAYDTALMVRGLTRWRHRRSVAGGTR